METLREQNSICSINNPVSKPIFHIGKFHIGPPQMALKCYVEFPLSSKFDQIPHRTRRCGIWSNRPNLTKFHIRGTIWGRCEITKKWNSTSGLKWSADVEFGQIWSNFTKFHIGGSDVEFGQIWPNSTSASSMSSNGQMVLSSDCPHQCPHIVEFAQMVLSSDGPQMVLKWSSNGPVLRWSSDGPQMMWNLVKNGRCGIWSKMDLSKIYQNRRNRRCGIF